MGHAVVWFDRRAAVGRALIIGVACALTLFVTVSGRSHAPTAAPQIASSLSHPSWAAKGAISNSLGRDQAAFHAVGASGGLIAGNPAQRLTTHFGSRGVLVRAGRTTFGLQLLAYGTAGHTQPVARVAPRAHANRVTYDHGAVTEWYANGPLGLEQGFDVRTPPAVATGDRLTIELGLRGNAHARADGHGGLSLSWPGGQRLRYTGLSATDAHGHVLGTALTMAGGRAVIHVGTAGAVYPLRIDPFIQVAKFGEQPPTAGNNLGSFAIAVQGTIAAVSAIKSPAGLNLPNAVDIFVANSGNWQLGATRVAQLTDAKDESFGASLSLTPDGRTLAVGAPNAAALGGGQGTVYVFEEPSGGWADSTAAAAATLTDQTAQASVSDTLGKAVSISSDGSLIAAGAPGRRSNPADSNTSSVGAVDVFGRVGMHWTNQTAPAAQLTHGLGRPGDQLGVSVALSGDGSTIVGGAWGFGSMTTPSIGEAWVWQQPTGGWKSNDSPNAVLLEPNDGVHAFDFFGGAAAISADAKTIVIGATGFSGSRGAAFVFTSPTGSWTGAPPASATLMSSDGAPEGVGRSVATDGKVVVAGTFTVAIGGNMGQGAAYAFVEPSAGWSSETETQKLVAGDGKAGDGLGQTVGISNGTAFAAAPFADTPGTTNDQGFVYAFGSFPTTGIGSTPAAPDGSNGWFRHPVRITVSAFDLVSPVAAIRCTLDPASVPPSFGALPASCAFLVPAGASVAANGQHAVYAAAVNAAGYASTPVSHVFRIDTVRPRVKCSPPPNFNVHGRGGLVTATVFDATSGAAAPIVAARANVRRAGNKSVRLTGRDNAGNATTVTCRYTVAAPKVSMGFSFGFNRFPRFTIFTAMTAKKVQRGAKIRIDCKGRGCPFAHRTVKVPTTQLVCKRGHKQCKRKRVKGVTNFNLEQPLANRRLAVGTVLTLSAFKPNTTRVTSTFKIRPNRAPTVTTKCLAPGSKKPFSC